MTKRTKTDTQAPLFAPPAQHATVTPEGDRLYNAVLRLRRSGFTVYRVSATQHQLSGRLVSIEQLVSAAAALDAAKPV